MAAAGPAGEKGEPPGQPAGEEAEGEGKPPEGQPTRGGPAESGGELVARVLPDVPGLGRELDYLVPPKLAGEVRLGSIVRIPLQGRRVRGWVVEFPALPEPGLVLRALSGVTGWGPGEDLLELAAWAGWRWAGPRRSLLVTASPEAAVKQLPPVFRPTPMAVALRSPARPAPAARALASRDLAHQAIAAGAGIHLLRLPPDYDASEVVMAAVAWGPVLVVVPSQERASAGAATLRRQGLAVARLPGDWAQARAGVEVVIGSRGAAWGPCPGMATAIVLDAHDEAFTQQQAPTWGASAVVAERARRASVGCLWVSPCPTLEMLAAAGTVRVPDRSTERAGWAPLQVTDLRNEDPRSGLFSEALVGLLRSGGRVVCVLNRKGRATLLACSACGELARCEECGGAVAVGGDGDLVSCRRCGASRAIVCARCGSVSLRTL
ncbi:MAG TPA: hypothetical protein VED59_07060, partial [Acidimicrobiales bacterium]|nr:hypothetical protein [Acidimicrobiales bacterium]